MPLTGELEHLPIVDVIQLIHSTRKSGTLNVYSRKGEGQLVFNNGYIVSATHSSERLKIGRILLESKIINQEELEKALTIQELSGDDRKPLIATLLEHCGLSKDAAYKALETLIEMTVVEMISWTRGIFTMDVDEIAVADDYRYLPRQLQTVSLDTQMVLMDALRIFDEKVHTGEIELSEEPLLEDPLQQYQQQEPAESESLTDDGGSDEADLVVSEDILGLADLDKVKRKKPHVFKGLEAFDPADIHRQVVQRTLPELAENDLEQLADYLSGLSTPYLYDSVAGSATRSQAVILYSCDEFLQHALMTVCKKEGILVFVTAEQNELDNLIERAQFKYLEPVLIFDRPHPEQGEEFSETELVAVRTGLTDRHPQLSMIQLASPLDFSFSLQSLNDGVRAVFPMPLAGERQDSYAADMLEFLNSFRTYIRGCFSAERRHQFARMRNSLSGLRLLRKAPDISLQVLQFVSEYFERTLTLIVDKQELIAERSVGIIADKAQGPAPSMKFRIPIRKDSEFARAVKSGESFHGITEDRTFAELLYPEIGAPLAEEIFLLPLKSNDRVITITYADFGARPVRQVSLDFLEFFAGQAGLAMENALFRKQLDSSARTEVIH